MLPILAALALSPHANAGATVGVATIGLGAIPLTQADGTALPSLAGKVVLFVNVASKCGFTPQYDGLEALYTKYKDQGFVIVGTPCNQFAGQEPGTEAEIVTFCKLNYGVDFPILQKADVNGDGRDLLYQWLVGSAVGGGKKIGWNFEKFVVDRSGNIVARYPSAITPEDPALITTIETALAGK